MSTQLRQRVYEANVIRCARITKRDDAPLTVRVQRRYTESAYCRAFITAIPKVDLNKGDYSVWLDQGIFGSDPDKYRPPTAETFALLGNGPSPGAYDIDEDANVATRATAYYAKWVGSADFAEAVWAKAYKTLHATETNPDRKGDRITEALTYAFGMAQHYLEPHEGLAEGAGFVVGKPELNAYRLYTQVVRLAIGDKEYPDPSSMVGQRANAFPTYSGGALVVGQSGAEIVYDEPSESAYGRTASKGTDEDGNFDESGQSESSGWNTTALEWRDPTGDTAIHNVMRERGEWNEEPRFSGEVERKRVAIDAEFDRYLDNGGPEYARLQMEWATADAEGTRASSRAQLARFGEQSLEAFVDAHPGPLAELFAGWRAHRSPPRESPAEAAMDAAADEANAADTYVRRDSISSSDDVSASPNVRVRE